MVPTMIDVVALINPTSDLITDTFRRQGPIPIFRVAKRYVGRCSTGRDWSTHRANPNTHMPIRFSGLLTRSLAMVAAADRTLAWACIVASLAGSLGAAPARAFELVTPSEAALPAAQIPALDMRGSPTRRPLVTVVSPPPAAGLVHSPVNLNLQFRAFGGAAIDPLSVVVTYLKQPAIDLTQRLTPYITEQGIDIPQAQVPPGKHEFWIELKDNQGRIGSATFSFQVGQ
jgi:hypothetical protein